MEQLVFHCRDWLIAPGEFTGRREYLEALHALPERLELDGEEGAAGYFHLLRCETGDRTARCGIGIAGTGARQVQVLVDEIHSQLWIGAGQQIWRVRLKPGAAPEAQSLALTSRPPRLFALRHGRLIVIGERAVGAVAPATGEVIWRVTLPDSILDYRLGSEFVDFECADGSSGRISLHSGAIE